MPASFWIIRIGGIIVSAVIFVAILYRVVTGTASSAERILDAVILLGALYVLGWCLDSISIDR